MKKYVIVAESGADLPACIIERYGIRVVPMHVEVEGRDYLDGSISIEELCGCYDKTGRIPKTSAVNPHQYREAYDGIMAENPDAIIIHIGYSSILTCSFQNALIADKDSVPVYHIDSKNVSGGQGFVVMKAARLIEERPDISPEELTAEIMSIAARTRFSFLPGNLDYLRAGGRVSNAQHLGAALLRIKPLIEVIDGEMLSTRKYAGSKKRAAMKMAGDFFSERSIEKDTVFFAYARDIDGDLKARLDGYAREMGVKETVWLKTGAVITSHSGPGGIGIAGILAKG